MARIAVPDQVLLLGEHDDTFPIADEIQDGACSELRSLPFEPVMEGPDPNGTRIHDIQRAIVVQHPQFAVGIAGHLPYSIAGQAIGHGEVAEAVAIEAGKALWRGCPNEAALVLGDGRDVAVREAVLHPEVACREKQAIGGCSRRSDLRERPAMDHGQQQGQKHGDRSHTARYRLSPNVHHFRAE